MGMVDEDFMRFALQEAYLAEKKGEVPIGAVLVFQDKIIASAHNQVESLKDATAHAEILCLRQGMKVLDNWRLLQTTLYSTLEPCPMCAGALFSSRVKRVVWGAEDRRQGADGSLFSILSAPHPIHSLEVRRNVLKEECGALLTRFFRNRRLIC